MATSTEEFLQLKQQATNGFIELSLDKFGETFSQIQGLFNDLTFDIGNISILSQTENKIKIKAFSKDFLFKKTLFKNESVSIEAEFILLNDEIEIVAICKFSKSPNKLSKLPGLIGDLLKPLDFIEINDLVYILTTKGISVINSETFPEYSNKEVNLKPGINLAGFIDLKNSGDIASLIIKPLKPIIGEGPYFMSWNMRNKIDVDFSLKLPQDIDIESLFRIKQPKLVIKPIIPVQISIDGSFEIALPTLPKVSVLGGFSYRTDGVRGKFNLDKIAQEIPAPFGYPGIHLSSLTLYAGISNAIANVGAEGSFYIGPNAPTNISGKPAIPEFGGLKSNQYKFVFDAIPGKITPKFAFLYLDKLTIEEYLKALTNQDLSLPAFLNKISIEQLMFHWCETPLGETKPDGTFAMPIFGLSGITNLFGHKAFTELQVDASNESKGLLVSDPINIGNGFLKITGNGKGTPEKYKGQTKVKPGGMEFSFSSTGNPSFLSFSTRIEILGLSGEIIGDVKENGINGNVKTDIGGILKNQLTLNFNGNNFEASTDIYAGITGMKVDLGKLGSITLDTFLEGGFSAKYIDKKYSNKMRLHFMVVGVNFDLGELEIEIFDLKKIVEILKDKIKEAIEKLGKNILAWLTATIEGLIVFVGDALESIGKALNETFEKTLEESAKLMKEVGYQAKQVGEALNKGFEKTEQELSNALKNAGYIAEEVGEVIKDVLNLPAETAAKILQTAGYTINEIGNTLKNVFSFGEVQTSEILTALGATLDQIGNVLTQVFNLPNDAVRETLGKLGFSLPDIDIRFPSVYIKAPEVYIKSPYIKSPYIKW
jgi:methyl-accepting chemotaxis protein